MHTPQEMLSCDRTPFQQRLFTDPRAWTCYLEGFERGYTSGYGRGYADGYAAGEKATLVRNDQYWLGYGDAWHDVIPAARDFALANRPSKGRTRSALRC